MEVLHKNQIWKVKKQTAKVFTLERIVNHMRIIEEVPASRIKEVKIFKVV